jgi:hypothetical protein
VTLSDSGRFSAPMLIRDVLRMTEPILHRVEPEHRDKLFLCAGRGRSGGFGPLTIEMLGDGLRGLLKRNQLPFGEAGFPKVNLAMVRPSTLAEAYRRSGDVVAVQRFANHRHLATTVRYVLDRVTDAKHDAIISRRQGKLLDEVEYSQVKTLTIRRSRISAVGVSNDCADLLDGPTPQKGECPAWLWPFNDPGFVVPDNAKYLAEVIRLLNALREARSLMQPDRFKIVYGTLFATVEDVVSKFPDERLAEAEDRAAKLGPLPELRYE